MNATLEAPTVEDTLFGEDKTIEMHADSVTNDIKCFCLCSCKDTTARSDGSSLTSAGAWATK